MTSRIFRLRNHAFGAESCRISLVRQVLFAVRLVLAAASRDAAGERAVPCWLAPLPLV
jgi:hypothetical protein